MSGIGPNTVNELWRAMQAAHNRYKNASTALEALMRMSSSDADLLEHRFQTEAASEIQRTAFENYIEARLQLSEFLASRQEIEPFETVVPGSHRSARLRTGAGLLAAALVALLFLSALQWRDLGHERTKLQAPNWTHNAYTPLDLRPDPAIALGRESVTSQETNQAVVRSTRAVAAAAQAGPSRRRHKALRRAARTGASIAVNSRLIGALKQDARTYREFALTPSKHSERIGPIDLKAFKVDSKANGLDVSIKIDNLRPAWRRIHKYEPLWIHPNGWPSSLVLVVTRISRNRVEGYISEPKGSLSAWRSPRSPISL